MVQAGIPAFQARLSDRPGGIRPDRRHARYWWWGGGGRGCDCCGGVGSGGRGGSLGGLGGDGGRPGTSGSTGADGEEAGPVPTLFVAVTVNV